MFKVIYFLLKRFLILDLQNRADTDNANEVKPEDVSQIETAMSAFEAIDSDSDADNEMKQLKGMNPKQQLALTIKNWSDLV